MAESHPVGTLAVSIRPARPSDAHEIALLTAQLGYDVDHAALAARLERLGGRQEHRLLVAEVDGQPVGWLHAALCEFIESDAFVLIAGLVVDRAHRRLGVGRVLMRDAEEWAREQGCAYVRLSSSSIRAAAHRFYEELGYTRIKTQYSFAKSLRSAGQEHLKKLIPRPED